MNAANEIRGEETLRLDGADYVLRPSFDAIVSFERDTGKGTLQLLDAASSGALTRMEAAAVLCACIRAGLQAQGNPMADNFSARRIGELLGSEPGGFLLVVKRLELLLLKAATGGFTPSGEAKAAEAKTAETPAAG